MVATIQRVENPPIHVAFLEVCAWADNQAS
jgi:hypothetical protein